MSGSVSYQTEPLPDKHQELVDLLDTDLFARKSPDFPVTLRHQLFNGIPAWDMKRQLIRKAQVFGPERPPKLLSDEIATLVTNSFHQDWINFCLTKCFIFGLKLC